jgi:hypothetical protein
MRSGGHPVKPMLVAGSQNDVMRKNDRHRALGRVFRRLIRVMPAPRCDPRPITFDRRKTGRFRRLESSEDIGRRFVRIESRVIHDVLEPPFD